MKRLHTPTCSPSKSLSLATCCNAVGIKWMHADCYKDKHGILTMGKQSRHSFEIAQDYSCQISFFFPFFLVTGELSTLRQMMKVPNEPGLSPNNGLEIAFLSDQSMASNPRKGQAKRCQILDQVHVHCLHCKLTSKCTSDACIMHVS